MDTDELRPILDELAALARDIEASPDADGDSADDLSPKHRRRAADLRRRLRRFGPLRIATQCRNFDGYGYVIVADAERRLLVGEHAIATWSLRIHGETSQFSAGLWVSTDGERLPYPRPLLDALGVSEGLDEHGNFPTDWSEALELLEDEDDDEDLDDEMEA